MMETPEQREHRLARKREWWATNRERNNARQRAYSAANREKVHAWKYPGQARYKKSEGGRQKAREVAARQRLLYPDRIHARNLVKSAVLWGRLTKLPCEVCGNPKAQAHHPWGYSEAMALQVWWLCVVHHVGVHREAA